MISHRTPTELQYNHSSCYIPFQNVGWSKRITPITCKFTWGKEGTTSTELDCDSLVNFEINRPKPLSTDFLGKMGWLQMAIPLMESKQTIWHLSAGLRVLKTSTTVTRDSLPNMKNTRVAFLRSALHKYVMGRRGSLSVEEALKEETRGPTDVHGQSTTFNQ